MDTDRRGRCSSYVARCSRCRHRRHCLPTCACGTSCEAQTRTPGAVNAAAFAGHSEQGRWTRADLLAREAEPWFDPAGFLLAERENVLLGFHWTKVHADGMGEVYVLGVDPAAHGLGLGSALLTRGLAWLAARGCAEVLLYSDEDNAGALRLYDKFGFRRYDVDVQWLAERDGS